MHWLYTQDKYLKHLQALNTAELLRLWLFAEIKDVAPLKSHIIEILVARSNHRIHAANHDFEALFTAEDIVFVYTSMPSSALVRRLVVEYCVRDGVAFEINLLSEGREDLPQDFLIDVIVQQRRNSAKRFHRQIDLNDYLVPDTAVFETYREKDQTTFNAYQSIAMMPQYRSWSAEEMRVAHYQKNRRDKAV